MTNPARNRIYWQLARKWVFF